MHDTGTAFANRAIGRDNLGGHLREFEVRPRGMPDKNVARMRQRGTQGTPLCSKDGVKSPAVGIDYLRPPALRAPLDGVLRTAARIFS